jgi:CheY-like chemotaxis protein
MLHDDDPTIIPIMRGRLVLVTERYGTPRALVTAYVRSIGYPARPCASGTEALAFLSRHRGGVQCLLAEMGLADMDGGELAERAVDLVPGLRVVVMAAPGDPAEQHLLRGYRDLPCLGKPIFADALRSTLLPLLGPPASDPSPLPSLGQPWRRRRTSGSRQP